METLSQNERQERAGDVAQQEALGSIPSEENQATRGRCFCYHPGQRAGEVWKEDVVQGGAGRRGWGHPEVREAGGARRGAREAATAEGNKDKGSIKSTVAGVAKKEKSQR